MSDSIWKKEIGFKRKKSDEAPPAEPPAPKQSIWKKEIGGKRKRDKEPPETAESLRVKELAFQRKLVEVAQAEVAQVVAPAPVVTPAPVVEPVVDVVPPAPPAPVVDLQPEVPAPVEPDSIWKKEISFRRKPAEAEAGAAPPELVDPTPDALSAPPVSIWKKEISFRRKPEVGTAGESIWTKDLSLRRKQARSAQVRALAEEALRAIDETAVVEPWLAGPELPPEPAPEPQPVAAPIPAPPAPAERKPSIWKRELGKSKSKEPKVEKVADAPKGPKEPKAKREKKPRTRLRDVKLSLPKPSPKAHASSGHPVKRLVGLKIGASQLAAARVNNNGAAELVQVVRQPLDQGVVVGGEVRDPEALAIALKQFFTRNKLPRKNVRLGIASNRIGVRVFDLVGIDDEKQLENAIRFRAQEALPIPLDEAVLDYHVLGESVDADGTVMQRVLLVVAYRELVERYVSACKKAGITLAGVDLEAFALLRALAAPRGEDDESDSALVAVSIGHDRSTFAVSDGRICEFTRVIDWGGATLSVAIARALDLAPSEVEPLKRLVSLESPAVPEGVEIAHYTLAVDAVRRQVQAFARELVSSLQFYQHQPGSLGIGEIVITGGTAGLAGLAAELQSMIGVRVRVGDPLARLKVPKKLAVDDELGSLAIAIGLGIED
ncbi:MAG TPA: type IV pilus assembly protein PilM [Gaiellaceae bacterium]|jgi:type IV pilus assembly protein PilM